MPFRGNFKRFKFSYIFADLFLRTRLHNSKRARARARARLISDVFRLNVVSIYALIMKNKAFCWMKNHRD